MERDTVLQTRPRDLRALPLTAREGFFASQFDGRLTLEEVAEVAGFELAEASQLADRLLEAGAIARIESIVIAPRRPATKARGAVEEKARPVRVDPRADSEAARPARRRSASLDMSAAKRSLRPAGGASSRSIAPRAERSRSRKSMRLSQASPDAARKAGPLVELEPETVAKIEALEEKLGAVDHYALLDVPREAEKKAIRRAYFGFASTFHPDRYFGKNIGSMQARIERIFHELTEAHDTLVDADRRAAYDARLAKPERRGRPSMAPRKSSKSLRAPPRSVAPKSKTIAPKSKTIAPKGRATIAPESKRGATMAPKSKASLAPKSQPLAADTPPESSRTLIGVAPPPRPVAEQAPASAPASSRARAEQLRAAMCAAKAQGSADMLVKAAEEALKRDDFVAAANNYRLALAHSDDPLLRLKFEDVDTKARIVRFEKNIAPAQAAEREQRWADAAVFLLRAFDARPEPDVAARAAQALHKSAGDLDKAAKLAEQAAAAEPRNLGFLAVLGEIYAEQTRIQRAEEICAEMRAIAPKDVRVEQLAQTIARKARSVTKVY